MLDIDNFKKLNDSLGHDAGDAALIHLVTVIREALRPQDTLARFGGEEFIIILPSSDRSGATRIAEKVRQAVLALQMEHAGSSAANHISVSLGAATCPSSEICSETRLLDTVDKALYAAKHGGRNRVHWLCVSDPLPPEAGSVEGQDPPNSNYYI